MHQSLVWPFRATDPPETVLDTNLSLDPGLVLPLTYLENSFIHILFLERHSHHPLGWIANRIHSHTNDAHTEANLHILECNQKYK